MASNDDTTASGVTPQLMGKEVLASLVSLLAMGRGRFTLVFVYYERQSQRRPIMTKLRRALADWKLTEVSLQDPSLDLRNLSGRFFENLQEIAQQNAPGQTYDAVLLLDWEDRLALDQPLERQPSTSLLGVFNMGRHLLEKAFSCPFVVLVPQQAMTTLLQLAPDFVSWQSGAFCISVEAVEVEAEMRAAVEGARGAQGEDIAAAAERLEGCLDAVQGECESDLPVELIAETRAQAGELYLSLGNAARAAQHFEALEHWARAHGMRQWRKRARHGLRVARRQLRKQPHPTASATAPWDILRGAAALTDEDRIYGREEDLQQILKLIVGPRFRFGTLWGETGCGKTSLAQAGLVPALRRQGYLPVYLNRYDNLEEDLVRAVAAAAGLLQPAGSLSATLQAASQATGKAVVLLCDQFEQVFTHPVTRDRQTRDLFLRSLAACASDLTLPVRCLLLVRADHLYCLTEFDALTPLHAPLTQEHRYELRWLRKADAARVLSSIKRAVQAVWPEPMIEAIVADLASDGRVKPVQIQLVAAGLYLRHINTLDAYIEVGRADGVLKDYLSAVFDTLSHPAMARRVVRSLVIPANPPVHLLRPAEEIAREVHTPEPEVRATLDGLIQAHIVHARKDTSPVCYELVHDVLVEPALRATTVQEIGLSIIRSALARGRRLLRRGEYRAAVRTDLTELPERQQPAARKLLRCTRDVLLSLYFAVVCAILLSVLTTLQFTAAYIRIEPEPAEPLVVYRGLRRLDFLPGFLGPKPLYDTGLTAKNVPSNKRSAIEYLRLRPWDGVTSPRLLRLFENLDPGSAVTWLFYIGDWKEGFRRWGYLRETALSVQRPTDLLRQDDPPRLSDPPLSVVQVMSERTIPSLLAFLTADEPSAVKVLVVRALVELWRTQPGQLVPALLPLLRNDDGKVREEVVKVLGHLGGERAHEVVPALQLLLRDSQVVIRKAAAEALGKLGEVQPQEVFNALLPLLRDDVSWVQEAAAKALEKLGKVQPQGVTAALFPLLHNDNRQVALAATRVLGELGRGQAHEAVPVLRPLLRDRQAAIRSAAAEALGKLGEVQPQEVTAALLPLLRDDDNRVLLAAVGALGRIGKAQVEEVVPALRPLLRERQPDIRKAAAEALGKLGEVRPQEVTATFLPLLHDNQSGVVSTVAAALRKLGKVRPQEVIAGVEPLLRDNDDRVRLAATRALKELGRARVQEVVPALRPLLRDRQPDIRRAAVEALGELGEVRPEEVIAALLPLLHDDDRWVRQKVAEVLGELEGAQTQEVMAALLPLLGDNHSGVQHAVAWALRKLGQGQVQPREVIAALLPLLDDTESWVRQAAALALGQLGRGQAREVVPRLVPMLYDSGVRQGATQALWELGRLQPQEVIAAVRPLVRDKDGPVRAAAARVLTELGEVQPLLPLLHDDDGAVRWVAAIALGQLRRAQPQEVITAIRPLVRDNYSEVRRVATEVLVKSWLFLALQTRGEPVYRTLMNQLASPQSRLSAGYREAIIQSVAHWYNAGRSEDRAVDASKTEETSDEEEDSDEEGSEEEESSDESEPAHFKARAQSEHRKLQKQLENICYNELRLWLRSAACRVWLEAYRLRQTAREPRSLPWMLR